MGKGCKKIKRVLKVFFILLLVLTVLSPILVSCDNGTEVNEKKTYTVTFSPNPPAEASALGETAGKAAVLKDKRQTFYKNEWRSLSPNVFVIEGYIFKGWGVSKDSVEADFLDKDNYCATANVTLYALWQKDTGGKTYINLDTELKDANNVVYGTVSYTQKGKITFHNGGLSVDLYEGNEITLANNDKLKVERGQGEKADKEVTITITSSEGKELLKQTIPMSLSTNQEGTGGSGEEGGGGSGSGGSGSSEGGSKNSVYVVSYYTDSTTLFTYQSVKYGEKTTAPTVPTIEGKEFDGWYITKDGGQEQFDFTNTKIVDNTLLTAKYRDKNTVATPLIAISEENKVSITSSTENATIKYSLDEGKTWQSYSAPFPLTASKVVYAKAEGAAASTLTPSSVTQTTCLVTYSVTFNLNYDDGNSTSMVQKFQDKDKVRVADIPPIPGGSYIVQSYKIGQSAVTFPYTVTKDTTIDIAIKNTSTGSTSNICTVAFYTDSILFTSVEVEKGNKVAEPQDIPPSKIVNGTEVVFDGWIDNVKGTQFDFTNTPVNKNYTLIAKWKTRDTVASPVITVANGVATITCATSGATIEVKRGSGEFELCSAPFPVTNSILIEAKASKTGMITSSSTILDYKKVFKVNFNASFDSGLSMKVSKEFQDGETLHEEDTPKFDAIGQLKYIQGEWKDGNKDATFPLTVTKDLTLTKTVTTDTSKLPTSGGGGSSSGGTTGSTTPIVVTQTVTQYSVTIITDPEGRPTVIGNLNSGDTVSQPLDPTPKPGYIFDSWVDVKTAHQFDFTQQIKENTVIYAKFRTLNTVASPIITLIGNSVELTCSTPGAAIKYSIDGSVPATTYNGIFTVSGNQVTIKAVASKQVAVGADPMLPSDVAIKEYKKPCIVKYHMVYGNGEKVTFSQKALYGETINMENTPTISITGCSLSPWTSNKVAAIFPLRVANDVELSANVLDMDGNITTPGGTIQGTGEGNTPGSGGGSSGGGGSSLPAPDPNAKYSVTFYKTATEILDTQLVQYNHTATRPTDLTTYTAQEQVLGLVEQKDASGNVVKDADGNTVMVDGYVTKQVTYIFDGWILSTTQAAFDFSTPITKDIILVAKWHDTGTVANPVISIEGNSCTITCSTAGAEIKYSLDGKTWQSYTTPITLSSTCTVYAQGTKEAKPPANPDDPNSKGTPGLNDSDIVTREYKSTFHLIYEMTYANDLSMTINQIVNDMTKLELSSLPALTRTGYDSYVWQIGGQNVSFPYTVTSDVTLKTSWTPHKYTVSFSLEGGKLGTATTVASQQVEYKKRATNPGSASKTATGKTYRFDGWSIDGKNLFDFNTPIEADILLKAVYTEVVISTGLGKISTAVPYKKDDGTTATEDITTWKQQDSRWGNLAMQSDDATNTITKYGCMATATSKIASSALNKVFYPSNFKYQLQDNITNAKGELAHVDVVRAFRIADGDITGTGYGRKGDVIKLKDHNLELRSDYYAGGLNWGTGNLGVYKEEQLTKGTTNQIKRAKWIKELNALKNRDNTSAYSPYPDFTGWETYILCHVLIGNDLGMHWLVITDFQVNPYDGEVDYTVEGSSQNDAGRYFSSRQKWHNMTGPSVSIHTTTSSGTDTTKTVSASKVAWVDRIYTLQIKRN